MIYTVTLNPALDYFMEYDKLELGEVNRTATTNMQAGGKGIMESRMLKKIGFESTALGFIGGFPGKFIEDSLVADGIKSNLTEIAANSRINVKLKAANDEETSLDAAGPQITEAEIAEFFKVFDSLTADDIVIFAGTIPASLDENFYEQLIAKVKAKGAKFAIDIDGHKLLDSLPSGPLVIKPNKEELEEIFSVKFESKEDIIPYGKKMLAMGPENVMVSMAGDGALLFTGDKVYFAKPVKGSVKNSIGAGDATIAGFVAEWSRSKDPVKAFRQGTACGTAKVFSLAMPTSEFLEKCFNEIEIEEVSLNGN